MRPGEAVGSRLRFLEGLEGWLTAGWAGSAGASLALACGSAPMVTSSLSGPRRRVSEPNRTILGRYS